MNRKSALVLGLVALLAGVALGALSGCANMQGRDGKIRGEITGGKYHGRGVFFIGWRTDTALYVGDPASYTDGNYSASGDATYAPGAPTPPPVPEPSPVDRPDAVATEPGNVTGES